MARREPIAKLLTMAVAWIVIFAAGFVLFTFRDDFGYLAQRLKAEAVGSPVTEGRVTRIPMAIDGHFWVKARLNGRDVKFLVDSGATMTTIDRNTANADLNVLGMNYLSTLSRWGVEGRWLILVS
jgi:aspartyl protease family protein